MSKTVVFSREIYSRKNIEYTMSAFDKICTMDLSVIDNNYVVFFSDNKLPMDRTIKEFENYLIGIVRQNEF